MNPEELENQFNHSAFNNDFKIKQIDLRLEQDIDGIDFDKSFDHMIQINEHQMFDAISNKEIKQDDNIMKDASMIHKSDTDFECQSINSITDLLKWSNSNQLGIKIDTIKKSLFSEIAYLIICGKFLIQIYWIN